MGKLSNFFKKTRTTEVSTSNRKNQIKENRFENKLVEKNVYEIFLNRYKEVLEARSLGSAIMAHVEISDILGSFDFLPFLRGENPINEQVYLHTIKMLDSVVEKTCKQYKSSREIVTSVALLLAQNSLVYNFDENGSSISGKFCKGDNTISIELNNTKDGFLFTKSTKTPATMTKTEISASPEEIGQNVFHRNIVFQAFGDDFRFNVPGHITCCVEATDNQNSYLIDKAGIVQRKDSIKTKKDFNGMIDGKFIARTDSYFGNKTETTTLFRTFEHNGITVGEETNEFPEKEENGYSSKPAYRKYAMFGHINDGNELESSGYHSWFSQDLLPYVLDGKIDEKTIAAIAFENDYETKNKMTRELLATLEDSVKIETSNQVKPNSDLADEIDQINEETEL